MIEFKQIGKGFIVLLNNNVVGHIWREPWGDKIEWVFQQPDVYGAIIRSDLAELKEIINTLLGEQQ